MYISFYPSPLGEIILASDGTALTGLWFRGQKYECAGLGEAEEMPELAVFSQCREWLDAYFTKSPLPPLPPLAPRGTDFQRRVWAELLKVEYGEVKSYGDIAKAVGCKSARAVGSAVGKNPVSILIPCHRIVGSHGSLTGYAGGLERKTFLLQLEGSII